MPLPFEGDPGFVSKRSAPSARDMPLASGRPVSRPRVCSVHFYTLALLSRRARHQICLLARWHWPRLSSLSSFGPASPVGAQ